MLVPVYTNQFGKDLKRVLRRGRDAERLKTIIGQLVNQSALEQRHKDYALKGNFKERRKCHIAPDWLLIYRIDHPEIIFERTGTHADLFG